MLSRLPIQAFRAVVTVALSRRSKGHNSIPSSLNVLFASTHISEHAFSHGITLSTFTNVPLTTKRSSLRNKFSHPVIKDIIGAIHHRKKHLEPTKHKICFQNIASWVRNLGFQEQCILVADCNCWLNQYSILPFRSVHTVYSTSLSVLSSIFFFTANKQSVCFFARDQMSTRISSENGL